MRNIFKKTSVLLFIALIFATSTAFSQVPQAINFQAIARDGSGNPMVNTNLQIRLSVVDSASGGTIAYQELRALQTNAYGSFSFQIGVNPNFTTIGTFQNIDWTSGSKFLKIDYDPTNTFTFSLTLGTIEFVTVPYAFAAESVVFIDASGAVDGDVLVYNASSGKFEPSAVAGTSYTAGTGISISGNTISNSGDLSDSNELQTLSLSGTTLSLSNGGGSVTLPTGTTYTAGSGIAIAGNTISANDVSATNELQTLSISNDTIYLSNGGFVKLPSVNETDPIFIVSEAANITTTDIINLSNLSGINSGDQDISGININMQAIKDTAAQIRADIQNVTTYAVGDFAQGGIVFWVDETGQHGLVCAKSDQGAGSRWYAGTNGNTQAKGDGIYSGKNNTSIIISAHVAIGDDGSTYAARLCNELEITEGGTTYGDWYLPSKQELNLMYQNKATIDAIAVLNGGSNFANSIYWSSSEVDSSIAYRQYFFMNYQDGDNKNNINCVRAIRAF